MARQHKKTPGTRAYKNYTEEQLNEALGHIVEDRMSINEASTRYKILYGTLHNKYRGRHVLKTGGQQVFTDLEEKEIPKSALKCSDLGFPLDLLDLRMLAKSYLDRRGRVVNKFKNNLPGKDWVLSLLQRHKNDVAQRVSHNINKARAKISRASLVSFFDEIEETLQDVPASNIFNHDETNVTDDRGSKKLIYRRGIKYPENIVNHSKSCTTTMMCGAADGTLLSPYVIYRSEHLYDTWKEGGIHGDPCCGRPCCSQGCRFNRTSHGWMDAITFEDWFVTTLLPHVRRLEGKKVIIGDNSASRFNDNVLALCEQSNIAFVCLVPHSTHLCQPLDVAFFKPFKVAWRNVLSADKVRHHNASGIAKQAFPALLEDAIERMDTVAANTNKEKPGNGQRGIKRNLMNGFFATGIWPLNRHKVLEKVPEGQYEPAEDIIDSLAELLRERRYNGTNEVLRRKKQRLNVVPGRSVGTHESSSSEDEDVPLQDGSDDEAEFIRHSDNGEASLKEVESTEPERSRLQPETFILVKYVDGRKRKTSAFRYVCKVIEKFSRDEFTVVGFKKIDEEKSKFKLIEMDLSTVVFSDIIAVSPTPDIKDGEYNFGGFVDVLEL